MVMQVYKTLAFSSKSFGIESLEYAVVESESKRWNVLKNDGHIPDKVDAGFQHVGSNVFRQFHLWFR